MVPVAVKDPRWILRLPDKCDVEAWDQFVSIHEPLVYRLARAKGFQDADAREVVQEVLVAVSQAVYRWDPDPQRGRFRDWLFRIARNCMVTLMTRRRYRPLGTGDSNMVERLEQVEDRADMQLPQFDVEYRREVFPWAAEQVREQVREKTWQAFWRTSIEGHSTEETARELRMTSGAVHIARSRVRSRLRAAVARFESKCATDFPG